MAKTCLKCGKEKTQFYKSRSTKDGYQAQCKECSRASYRSWSAKNREKVKFENRKWHIEHRTRVRENKERYNLLSLYGITPKAKALMIEGQKGRCPICDRDFGRGHLRPCIDHDHDSGAIRGVLCSRCNISMGHFDDSPDLLRQAADYLERCLKRPILSVA